MRGKSHQFRLALGLLDLGDALAPQGHVRALGSFLGRGRRGSCRENRGLREGDAGIVGREARNADVVISLWVG